jgi:serine/threonine protein kinase
MAPEVVSKVPHNPNLSDRWSLGILLYTMLNGCCPFKAPTQKELFEKIVNGEYWYLSDISDEAKQLIGKFLFKNPH